VATIGFFDGVHLGHRTVIDRTRDVARLLGLPSLVITFDIHPKSLVRENNEVLLLTTFEHKIELLTAAGVDIITFINFDPDFASMPAEKFCRDILQEQVKARAIVVGDDFRFGKDARGDPELLRHFFQYRGVDIHIVSKLRIGGVEVSSSNIRKFLQEGDVERAALFLGRLPSARGTVEPGSRRGKNLGFPTINLRNLKEQQLPKNGVYAGYARHDSHHQKAMIYVGTKPTFNETERVIEAHLLDLPEQRENLYGRQAEILFLKRTRDEMKFENAGKLREQLEKDKRTILDILKYATI